MYSAWLLLFMTILRVNLAIKSPFQSNRIPSNGKDLPKLVPKSHSRQIPKVEEPLVSIPASKEHKKQDNSEDDNIPKFVRQLTPSQRILYGRALHHDFNFAQFSQPCTMYSADELEAYLEILDTTMNPQGQDHITPDDIGTQLEKLFNQSIKICDFRNLLTCQKPSFTCSCAHPSLGINHDGVCGVNIGHPCEISKKTLEKHGIPARVKGSPLTCLLENAECNYESDVELSGGDPNPIRKICKCRNGFWGPSCSRRQKPDEDKLKLADKSEENSVSENKLVDLSKEMELGQAIWLKDGVMSSEYFMHPEEIRDELIKLMNQKQMYQPDERFDEATSLVETMELDLDKEEMVINDIHFRKLARLKFGSPCDPEPQVILDNPPVARDSDGKWINPPAEDIKSWQLGFIQLNKPLCNTSALLRCSRVSRKCECKSHLEMDSQVGRCRIPLGQNCDQDVFPILEFNPLNDRKRFSEMEPPECISGTECKEKPFFFQKKCWCQSGNCKKQSFDEEQYLRMLTALNFRFTLWVGDTCDPTMHQRVLNYHSDDDPGYEKRFGVFTEVINNPEARFCDIDAHLNCSEVSRVCECWKQLQPVQRKNGDVECVAMNLASCGRTFKSGKFMFTSEGAQIWQVEKMLERRFLPGCVPGAVCADGRNPQWAGRCVCSNPNKTGEHCDERKSIVASSFKTAHIPQNDAEEIALLRVFFDLNSQTVLMEQLMSSTINEICDSQIGLTLDRIIKFWKQLANSSVYTKEEKLLPYFISAAKWTKYLVGTAQGKSASLCNATLGLRCDRTSERCKCHRGSRWLGNKCYLEVGETCDPKPRADWVPTCVDGSRCVPEDAKSRSFVCKVCKPNQEDSQCSEFIDDDINLWDTWNIPMTDATKAGKRQSTSRKLEASDVALRMNSDNYIAVKVKTQDKKSKNGKEDANVFIIGRKTAEEKGNEEVKSYFAIGPQKLPEPNKPSELTRKQKDSYVEEIVRMLKEIMETRLISYKQSCFYEDETKLSEIFPLLPVYSLSALEKPLEMTYSILSRLYWKGISFCNRNKMLKCTSSHVCGCSDVFGLVEESGECRLKEGSHCSREESNIGKDARNTFPQAKKKFPFHCQKGTICRQFDYGLPLCVKFNPDEDEEEIVRDALKPDGSGEKNAGERLNLAKYLVVSSSIILLVLNQIFKAIV